MRAFAFSYNRIMTIIPYVLLMTHFFIYILFLWKCTKIGSVSSLLYWPQLIFACKFSPMSNNQLRQSQEMLTVDLPLRSIITWRIPFRNNFLPPSLLPTAVAINILSSTRAVFTRAATIGCRGGCISLKQICDAFSWLSPVFLFPLVSEALCPFLLCFDV